MSNSSLATYTKITSNRTSPREGKIDCIAIHCMAVQWTAKQCADYFYQLGISGRQASSNYCVGKDGSIAISVPEADRSWCTSSRAVDKRAVTIEVASDSTNPCKVTDAAYEALIKLCADICKRNNISALKWSTDKATRKAFINGTNNGCNIQVHRDWDTKTCPGDYLYGKMADIAKRVNALISGVEVKINTSDVKTNTEEVCNVTVRELSNGCTGGDVLSLQGILLGRGLKGKDGKQIVCDGDFGNNTEYALIQYQKAKGLVADGVCGQKTWAKLLSK